MKKKQGLNNYYKFVQNFRREIPFQYNQIELVDELMNDDIDFYISISNRSDGKTFNYVAFFMKLAIEFDIKFMLISRHFELRHAYQELVEKIAMEQKHFKENELYFRRTQDYVSIGYDDKDIGLITDLNNATDLKYHSNYLKEFPIIIYDEFLALESDYLIDEWDKLKTIYESVDRNHGNIEMLNIPKIVLLGNAVNFSSPLLANLNIYNTLQKHQMNTARQYDNVYLEMRRNAFSNEKRNTRAFKSENDAMTTGEFMFNTYNLADDVLRDHIARDGDFFHIKTESSFIKVMYNIKDYQCNIKVVPYSDDYAFCTDVKDVKENAMYLKHNFYKERQPKRYYRNSNLHFDNAYSKQHVLSDTMLIELDINKCIKQYITLQRMTQEEYNDNRDRHEKMYDDNYIERTKRKLIKKYS